jgi:hypothetical protein
VRNKEFILIYYIAYCLIRGTFRTKGCTIRTREYGTYRIVRARYEHFSEQLQCLSFAPIRGNRLENSYGNYGQDVIWWRGDSEEGEEGR